MTTTLNSALALAANGYAVFPLQPRSKLPYPGMRGFLDATTDAEQIRKWWSVPGAEESNIGLRPAPGVVVVDVDKRHGGLEALETLKAEGKDLPDTLTVKTGGGGLHAFYTAPADVSWPKGIVTGIDLKAENGYLVAAPSVHESGGRYEWLDLRPMAPAPAWLVRLGRPKNDPVTVTVIDEDESESLPEATIAAVVAQLTPVFTEGRKHALSFAVAGWLRQRSWNQSDIVRVIEQLPSKNPRARVKDALDGYRAQNDHGWHTIRQLVGDVAAEQLDAVTPNPRREGQRTSAAALVEGMAASAVTPPSAAAPLAVVPPSGAMPAWYVPSDLTDTPRPIDFVVPDLELAPGRVNMIVGYSNVGKSITTQALAFAIAMGLPAWGQFPVRRRRVLYLDAENIYITLENFARLARAAGVSIHDLRSALTVVDSRFYMDSPNAEAEIAAVIQREAYGSVFVDTMRASAPTLDENAAEIARPLYMLGRVSVGTGSMISVLHHEKKPNNDKRSSPEHMINGHAAIHGALQVAISLLREDDSGLISVRPSKRIRRGFDPFQLRIVDVNGATAGEAIAVAGAASPGVRVEYVGAAAAKPVNEDTMSAAIVRILTWLRSNVPDGRQIRVDSLLKKTEEGGAGGRRSMNVSALERLERDGQVHVSGSPKMIGLVVDAPPYDPRSVAPPADPTAQDLWRDTATALGAQQ